MTTTALADPIAPIAPIAAAAGHDHLTAPMIPGAREPGMLTTFGVPAVVVSDGPSTMDAATIAAHQKEGGGGSTR